MGKDTLLINIYLKIHNKRPITMDDLRYLAQYDPECFEKTCKNVVYNIPETKPIMEPVAPEVANDSPASKTSEVSGFSAFSKIPDQQSIERVLDNLRRLEAEELPVANIEVEDVKSLLGNLFMELLFPHNDEETFISAAYDGTTSLFDKKA